MPLQSLVGSTVGAFFIGDLKMDELDYLADVLKEKCNSFKIENGRLTKYQITFEQWKANKDSRQALRDIVAKKLGKKK